MENPNILDMEYNVFSQIQTILENPSTMQSFLEVLPPDCTSENILISMEIESKQYNMTPAKTLLRILGSKGYRISDLIEWFEAIGLEKALVLLRQEEPLRIVMQPQKDVEVYEGAELKLVCRAVSYPPPEYQWYKGDDELLLEIDSVLSIKSVSLQDSGTYACLVTKWDSKRNAYEWLYSDFSNVKVIPSKLHVIPSLYQGPQPTLPDPVMKPEFHSSLQSCEQDTKFHVANSFQLKQLHENNSTQIPKLVMKPEFHSSLQSCEQDTKFHVANSFQLKQLHENNSTQIPKLVHNQQTSESPKQDDIIITKHPYVHGRVAQGMSLCLICEAVSKSHSVNYQWFKNRRPIRGETFSQLVLNELYPDPDTGERKWDYQCEVYNELDRTFSEIAVVELDEADDTTPCIAHQKYAFMIANDTYDHLENLQKPAADVKDLADMLSSISFKTFAFRNLTLTEMRNAFNSFCKMLVPGSYALFFFAGHGFELYGQTYLQPVDSTDSHSQHESMCSEYILQHIQERKPAMNILLIDACRKLPPNLSGNSKSKNLILPGKIFQAKMKNNTVYGYSTSFLCASHENDEETNSVFVKHLKKHITRNKCIQDILIMVQTDFARDPVARNVQFPVIKSTLAERRKLNDPVQDTSSNVQYDIMNWCDIKREIASKSFEISRIKATIIVEFHHHMEVFCNGIDVYVYLHVEPNANMFILHDMEINISFISPVLDVLPVNGVALKDIDLLMGRKNFLFKKEIFNLQKINTSELKGSILLKFCSKNFVKPIDFNSDIAKISELQLSINHLAASNVEEPLLHENQVNIINSLK